MILYMKAIWRISFVLLYIVCLLLQVDMRKTSSGSCLMRPTSSTYAWTVCKSVSTCWRWRSHNWTPQWRRVRKNECALANTAPPLTWSLWHSLEIHQDTATGLLWGWAQVLSIMQKSRALWNPLYFSQILFYFFPKISFSILIFLDCF